MCCSTEHLEMAGKKVLSRLRRRVSHCLRFTHSSMDAAFFRLGCFVTDHAVKVLVISLVVALALSSGMAKIRAEDRYDKLWATPGSTVDSANAAYSKFFATAHPAQIIVTSKSGGDGSNVLTGKILLETLRLHEKVLLVLSRGLRGQCQALDEFLNATSHFSAKRRAQALRNQSLDVSHCSNIAGVLRAFRYQATSILAAGGNTSHVISQYFAGTLAVRFPLALFVGEVAVPAAGAISKSNALRLMYTVDGSVATSFDFDTEFVNAVDEFSASSQLIAAHCQGPASLDRETDRSLSSDFWLVAISATVLLVFSVLNTGTIIFCDPLHSRMVVGLCGMLNVGLAIGASIGFATYCGVMFSAIQVAMICVILAIGVDDMFVLCDALTRQSRCLPLRERVGNALRQVGPSIAMTSMTDAVTFALVAINAVPGVESFAINATVAVVFDFVLQVTFFMACLALDEKRMDANRWDILCCCRIPPAQDSTCPNSRNLSINSSPAHGTAPQRSQSTSTCSESLNETAKLSKPKSPLTVAIPTSCWSTVPVCSTTVPSTNSQPCACACSYQPREKLLTYVFREVYAPALIHSRWLRVAAVVVAIALCSFSFYGVTQVSSELQLSDTLVDDSFVLKYQEMEMKYFSSVALQVDLITVSPDLSTVSSQDYLQSLAIRLKSSPAFQPYVASWYDELCDYAISCNRSTTGEPLAQADFVPLLRDFFHTKLGATFRHDVVMETSEGHTTVKSARLVAWQRQADTTDLLLQRMSSAQSLAATSPMDVTTHAYSYMYRFLHQVRDVRDTGYQVVVLSLVVVMAITWFFFEGSVVGALVCTALIAVVNLNLFGFMCALAIEYNHASHTVLIIGIGFSVDYVAHLVLAFARAKGASDQRVKTALAEMGSSVFSGALTTFLGLLALVFGSVEISRIFAKLICMLIALSAFYGLVLSPVILLYIGKKWKSISPEEVDTPGPALNTKHILPASSSSDLSKPPLKCHAIASKERSVSLQQLNITGLKPEPRTSETGLGNTDFSASISALPLPAQCQRKGEFNPKSRAVSLQFLPVNSRYVDVDIAPLYLAIRTSSDGINGDSFSKPLPLSSSVRCESSL